MNQQLMSVIRWLLVTAGALAVQKGWLTSDQLSGGVDTALLVGGGIVSLGTLAWSAYHNIQTKRAAAASAVISAASGTATPVKVSGLTMPTVSNALISSTAPADLAKVKGAT